MNLTYLAGNLSCVFNKEQTIKDLLLCAFIKRIEKIFIVIFVCDNFPFHVQRYKEFISWTIGN